MADDGEEDDPPEDHPKEEVLLEVPQEGDDEQGEPPSKTWTTLMTPSRALGVNSPTMSGTS